MSYSGLVTRIRTRRLEGSDNLSIGQVGPYQVIVSNTTPDGALGVFFEVDGQLSEAFAKQHDLVSRTDAEGKKAGGYFGNNRKVRTIKLRKAVSDGFWMPISCLEFTGVDIASLKEGDPITTVNGIEICRKFVSAATLRHIGNRATKVIKESKHFHRHLETAQFKRDGVTIPKGALLHVSAKLHGTCTVAQTRIRMADGSSRQIKDVRVGDQVLGVDTDGNITFAEVLACPVNGLNKHGWFKLTGKRRIVGVGNETFNLPLTSEHLVWNAADDLWVEAQHVKPDMQVVLPRFNLKPSTFQESVLLGKLLGDGYLMRRTGGLGACVQFRHKAEHAEYVHWMHKLLGNLANPAIQAHTSGYGSTVLATASVDSAWIRSTFEDMYHPETGKRQIPDWVVDRLDDLAVAIWYMDDGSLAHHESQRDRAAFASCAYGKADNEKLSAALTRLGYENVVRLTSNGPGKDYYRIYIMTDASDLLFSRIAKYVPEVMRYKLPEKYRSVSLISDVDNTAKIVPMLVNSSVTKVTFVPGAYMGHSTMYDLTTSTGNYFASDVLVHNSSRQSLCLDDVPLQLPLWKRAINYVWKSRLRMLNPLNILRAFRGELLSPEPFFPETKLDYRFLVGSRNVVLQHRGITAETPTGGADGARFSYYGSEAFRFKVASQFEGKLFPGECVYGEIVGFTGNGDTPIMGKLPIKDKELQKVYGKEVVFSYGNEVPNCTFYAYRITRSCEGFQVDLSHEAMVARCEQLGCKVVPLMCPPFIYDGNLEELRNKLEGFLEKPSILDPRHPEEGVVIRYEGPTTANFLKLKARVFLGLEDEQKNSDTHVDIEEAS